MQWKPVVGHENAYEVAEDGTVRSLTRMVRLAWHPFLEHGRVLAQIMHKRRNGRLRVSISANGKQRWLYVHQLVAAAFIGPRPTGMEVNHKDGNVRHNHWRNLEYCTQAENMAHGVRLKLFARGPNSCGRRMPEALRQAILLGHDHGLKHREISSLCDVPRTTVGYVIQRERGDEGWSQYKFWR